MTITYDQEYLHLPGSSDVTSTDHFDDSTVSMSTDDIGEGAAAEAGTTLTVDITSPAGFTVWNNGPLWYYAVPSGDNTITFEALMTDGNATAANNIASHFGIWNDARSGAYIFVYDHKNETIRPRDGNGWLASAISVDNPGTTDLYFRVVWDRDESFKGYYKQGGDWVEVFDETSSTFTPTRYGISLEQGTLNDVSSDWDYMSYAEGDIRLPVKGRAMHSYFAQTIGRNANYILANSRAPVLGSGWGVDAPQADSLLFIRLHSILWYPYDSIYFACRGYAGVTAGQVDVYAFDKPIPDGGPSEHYGIDMVGQKMEVYIIGQAWNEYRELMPLIPVAPNRMVYIYVDVKVATIEYWSIFGHVYSGLII